MSHQPVLLNEVIKFLDPRPGNFIIDGTIDGGGHAEAILEKIGPEGKLLGIDLDEKILIDCKKKFINRKNVVLAHGNYADLPEILKKRNLGMADGLFLDLGLSSEQLEHSGRGFSFLKDEPLLMTYDESRPPVRELLRKFNEKELAKIIFELSGEKFAMRIAKAIKEAERLGKPETSGELAEMIRRAAPKGYERGRINPATRTFQAMRICANDELGNLKKVLHRLGGILKRGGRITIVSFHSLEDRIVKRLYAESAREGTLEVLTPKPVAPAIEEIKVNPKSRSAKLRAAKLIADY